MQTAGRICVYPLNRSMAAIVGYDVVAADGSVGKICEATVGEEQSYVVVDTGRWMFGSKRLIPAGMIARVDDDNHNVFLAMRRQELRDAPEFHDEHRERYCEDYYRQVVEYYRNFDH